MSERVDAARLAVRKVIRDARDKNKWRKIVRFRLWMPVVFEILLVAALLGYTNSRFPGFDQLHQRVADPHPGAPLDRRRPWRRPMRILVGYLDLSVGGMIGLGVVVASFVIGAEASVSEILIGIGIVLLCGVALGLVNAGLIRGLKIPSIIATLATLSILDGISLTLRPTAQGVISPDFVSVLTATVGPIPVAFIVIVVVAGLLDLWLHASGVGTRGAGGGFRRAVGETRRGQDQLGPGPGHPPPGRARGRGLVLRHGPIAYRQRTGRLHLRAEQHHRRRPGGRIPRRWPGHVHRWHGGSDPPRAHPHGSALPRSLAPTMDR